MSRLKNQGVIKATFLSVRSSRVNPFLCLLQLLNAAWVPWFMASFISKSVMVSQDFLISESLSMTPLFPYLKDLVDYIVYDHIIQDNLPV